MWMRIILTYIFFAAWNLANGQIVSLDSLKRYFTSKGLNEVNSLLVGKWRFNGLYDINGIKMRYLTVVDLDDTVRTRKENIQRIDYEFNSDLTYLQKGGEEIIDGTWRYDTTRGIMLHHQSLSKKEKSLSMSVNPQDVNLFQSSKSMEVLYLSDVSDTSLTLLYTCYECKNSKFYFQRYKRIK